MHSQCCLCFYLAGQQVAGDPLCRQEATKYQNYMSRNQFRLSLFQRQLQYAGNALISGQETYLTRLQNRLQEAPYVWYNFYKGDLHLLPSALRQDKTKVHFFTTHYARRIRNCTKQSFQLYFRFRRAIHIAEENNLLKNEISLRIIISLQSTPLSFFLPFYFLLSFLFSFYLYYRLCVCTHLRLCTFHAIVRKQSTNFHGCIS